MPATKKVTAKNCPCIYFTLATVKTILPNKQHGTPIAYVLIDAIMRLEKGIKNVSNSSLIRSIHGSKE